MSVSATLLPAILTMAGMAAMASLTDIAASAGTMYRWVDAQGVVHYSDTPQPGAQQLPMPNAQTYRDTTPAATSADAAPTTSPAPIYQSCAIVQPAPDAELYAPDSVAVSVRVVPALRPGDQVSVTLDGGALPPTSSGALSFEIPQPERGTHTLSAVVRDPDGATLCAAAGLSFSVQRPSLLSPQSPARGH